MDGHPTPEIRVGRLLLRPYGEREADDFVRVVSDPGVARWMGDGGPFPPVEALAVFERLQTRIYPDAAWPVWAVVVDGSVQGHAEVKPSPDGRVDGWEVVYALLPAAQGRGLGTELAAALTGYAHASLCLDEVHATVDPGNAPSLAVLHRLGYVDLDDLDEGGTPVMHLVHRR